MNPIIEEEVRKRVEQLQRVIEKGLNSNDLETAINYFDEAIAMAEEDGVSYTVAAIWGMKACAFMDAGAPPMIAIINTTTINSIKLKPLLFLYILFFIYLPHS